jgi:Na+/H+ antiporter NhaC
MKNMDGVIPMVLFFIIILLPVILIAGWFSNRKAKKKNEKLSRLTPEEKEQEQRREIENIGNLLSVIIPLGIIVGLKNSFGWEIAILVSVSFALIAKLLILPFVRKHWK